MSFQTSSGDIQQADQEIRDGDINKEDEDLRRPWTKNKRRLDSSAGSFDLLVGIFFGNFYKSQKKKIHEDIRYEICVSRYSWPTKKINKPEYQFGASKRKSQKKKLIEGV